MIQKICRILEGKKILILGFGREGKATYRFVRKFLPTQQVTIADKNEISAAELVGAEILTGETYQQQMDAYDLVIKSPGIVLEQESPAILSKLTSQTELFLRAFADQVVGITGTKGKSTTASLAYHVLKQYHPNCLLMGNIGIPSFDLIEKIDSETIIVYELSCHQLEYTHVSPHIAVLLNLFEEHLDHYGTFEKYIAAKENICRYQTASDIFICNRLYADHVKPLLSKLITVSKSDLDAMLTVKNHQIFYEGKTLTVPPENNKLVGIHNLYNIGVVYAICRLYHISDEQFLAALETFDPLPHRLQNIGNYGGITFYDDSISTIGETTIQGIKSLKTVETLLIGGMDRGIDYTELVQFLLQSDVQNMILMPDTNQRLYRLFLDLSGETFGGKNIVVSNGLKEAVKIAKEITTPGKICLLSPAAASYGFFRDFEERGDFFQQYVKES